MRNFYVLATALEYMEEHIREPFALSDVAAACAVSLSGLKKLFTLAFGYSLKEYIQKRRHSLACYELVHTNESILDIALKYQYQSHEVFCRAFQKLRSETPSSYRKTHSLIDLYPKLTLNLEGKEMRKVDISELYQTLKGLQGSYVLCLDIRGFMEINSRYGYAAGDLVLAQTAKRIEGCLDKEMFVFRIGRDEFAVVTGLYEPEMAGALLERIFAKNGEKAKAGTEEIPFSLRGGMIRLPEGGLSYQEVLNEMLSTLGH